MWLHPPPTRYSYWESEFVGKLLHNAASTAERGDKLHTYSTLWTQLAKKGLVSVPDLARGGDSGEAGVHKILNTVEFRWDESDWLIAIVSTFPTVFLPRTHLCKQHGELECHRDWDMTFARPGYLAANPNTIYTYHHMGRPPDPQTSWAQAMTWFSSLQSLSKSWTANGLFGAFGRPPGIIAALGDRYLWHSATFPVVGSVLCLQHLLHRGVLLCSTW